MRTTMISIVAFTLATCSTLALADETNTTAPGTQTQPLPAAAAVTNVPEYRTVWKGLLFAAPSNAAPGVVAVLQPVKHQKTGHHLVRAEDRVLATRIGELSHSHKGTGVVLNGVLDPDGITILATDVYELPKEKKPEQR